ncbi:MAG TPA: glycosyltransferase [Mariprofundaceae bacterium]|nr:glycosyltransferase [Mariprofundaceae bacterium]
MRYGVSVVIPSYNYGDFISNAIDSVLAQANVDVDLIVVDDGSTDRTPDVLRTYGERIRVYRQENAGAASAKNLGIEKARHPLITFLDADDWLLEDSLFRRCQLLDMYPEYDWVYGKWLIASHDGNIVGNSNEFFRHPDGVLEGDVFPSLMSGYAGINTLTPLFRTSDVREIGGFCTRYQAAEDYDFLLRISRGKRVLFSDELFGVQRLHHSHLSANPEFRYLAEIKMLQGYRTDTEARQYLEPSYHGRLSNLYNYLACIYSEEGKMFLSCKAALLSIRHKPLQRFAYRFLFYTLTGRPEEARSTVKNRVMQIYSRIKRRQDFDDGRAD